MNNNILTVATSCLDDSLCNAIINLSISQNYTEDEDKIQNESAKFKADSHVEIYNIVPQEGGDFDKIMNWVDEFLPDNEDFIEVSHLQIITYPVDTYEFNTSSDEDTGQVMFNLSNHFNGGNLSVDGHIINADLGDMIVVNNPHDRIIGVLPVTAGEKWTLSIWFRAQEEKDEDNYLHHDYEDTSPRRELTDAPTFTKVVIK